MTRAAIMEPVITQLVAEGRELMASVRQAEDAAQVRRYELGKLLLKARALLPKRGSRADGWGHYLEAIELDEATAWRYMKLAGAVEADPDKFHVKGKLELPTYEELGLNRREGALQPDAPPPNDGDAPVELLDVAQQPKPNRDAYCTPAPIAQALPKKLGTDPCSNPRSLVMAENTYSLEAGQNGLVLPWIRLTYVNGPFSDLMPWAEKLHEEKTKPRSARTLTGAGFLVNADNSPAWWHMLTQHLHLRLDFNDRQEFIPPPGVEPSKNDRPQTLLMDEAFWAACDQRALLQLGTLWKQLKA